jgi:hypothetical protein
MMRRGRQAVFRLILQDRRPEVNTASKSKQNAKALAIGRDLPRYGGIGFAINQLAMVIATSLERTYIRRCRPSSQRQACAPCCYHESVNG